MPDAALAMQQRRERVRWALPGSGHDRLIRWARAILPAGIGVLVVLMLFAPMLVTNDLSFVLSKDRVDMATERMRIEAATYRGEDANGNPFVLRAASAVQKTSKDPVVQLRGLTGEITMPRGPATIAAPQGLYNMDDGRVTIDGPLAYRSADGYRLDTRDVDIDLAARTISSRGPVDGSMALGRFAAGRISVDLTSRTVVLDGRARLNITQGVTR